MLEKLTNSKRSLKTLRNRNVLQIIYDKLPNEIIYQYVLSLAIVQDAFSFKTGAELRDVKHTVSSSRVSFICQ